MNPQTLQDQIEELDARISEVKERAKAELKQLKKARRLAGKTLEQLRLL